MILMTLAEVAERAVMGEATVLKFSRSAGYSGFVDFKIALLLAFKGSPQFVYENVEAGFASPVMPAQAWRRIPT